MSDEGPHRLIGLFAVMVAASVTGASVGVLMVPEMTLGRILVVVAIGLLAATAALGIVKGELILGVAVGLGFVLLTEGLAQIAGLLTIGAVGLWFAALLAFVQRQVARRRD